MAGPAYARELAQFVAELDPSTIPPVVLERTRQSILNALAAALSAAEHENVAALIRAARSYGSEGDSPLIGRAERTGLLQAALINGYMAHVNDYDDTHFGTVYHTNSPVVPPLLGLAADRHASGRDVLHSLALGLEASIRLGIALGPAHYDIGWHITGTVGTVGAALSCARLLGLDARHTNFALGFALTQASGLRGQMFGTAAKGLNAGSAAMNGLLSTLMAEQDLDAAEDAIEGINGYASAAAPKPDLERITDGLGSSWNVPNIAFKCYAAGVATHPSIDSALELRRELGLTAGSSKSEVDQAIARLEEAVLTLPERYLHLPRGEEITAGIQAKFSVQNAVAVGFVKGSAGPRDFSDDIATDPQLRAFKSVLKMVGDPSFARDSARMDGRLRDGTTLTCHVEHGSGSPGHPMSYAEVRAKLLDAGLGLIDTSKLEQLADMVQRIDQMDDAGGLFAMAARPTATAAR
jgi:2-methylcitrate dehydratase PrpD